MHTRALLLLLAFVASCHVRPESLVPAGVGARAPQGSEYLGARPGSFVVLGDETSFVWPALLQELLEAHAGNSGSHRVLNAASERAAIGAWSSDGETSAQGQDPFRALTDSLAASRARPRPAGPAPTTALCMVSLRGLGDERGPVKSENDMVGAEMGADALERLALGLRRIGIERVVFATPLYVHGAGPEPGLEHVAIERLLARGHAFVAAGPDLFRASRRYYPDAYAQDGRSPNEFGLKLVAEEWYRWLAGPEARESVVEQLYAQDYDVEAIEAAHAASRVKPRP